MACSKAIITLLLATLYTANAGVLAPAPLLPAPFAVAGPAPVAVPVPAPAPIAYTRAVPQNVPPFASSVSYFNSGLRLPVPVAYAGPVPAPVGFAGPVAAPGAVPVARAFAPVPAGSAFAYAGLPAPFAAPYPVPALAPAPVAVAGPAPLPVAGPAPLPVAGPAPVAAYAGFPGAVPFAGGFPYIRSLYPGFQGGVSPYAFPAPVAPAPVAGVAPVAPVAPVGAPVGAPVAPAGALLG